MKEFGIEGEIRETPRTDKAAYTAEFGGGVVVDADFAQQLERENEDLRTLLDKASKKKQKMSETPRTDKAAFVANFSGTVFDVVDAYFARQLEIELGEAKAKLRKLRKKK